MYFHHFHRYPFLTQPTTLNLYNELELELERYLFDKVQENAWWAQQYNGQYTMPGDPY